MTQAENSKQVTLHNLLENKLKEPFVPENFRAYLKGNLADENLEYYEEVERFKKMAQNKKKTNFSTLKSFSKTFKTARSSSLGNISQKSSGKIDLDKKTKDKLLETQRDIKDRFIEIGSPKEINIAFTLRSQVQNDIEKSEQENEPNLEVFDTSAEEVFDLLEQGHFAEFVHSTKNKNISITERRFRLKRSAATFFVFVGLEVVIFIFTAQVFLLRLIPLLFLFSSMEDYFAWKESFCPYLACTRKYMMLHEKKTWSDIVFGAKAKQDLEAQKVAVDNYVEDQDLFEQFYARGIKAFLRVAMLTTFVGLTLVFIPPSFY
eukprot:snap_masked-scaffold_20-processed-gene-4.35-mRNA-1 protein AED:1.00 eAED:1.00 QI:0/-1/0/0/-1/1/1/0/318